MDSHLQLLLLTLRLSLKCFLRKRVQSERKNVPKAVCQGPVSMQGPKEARKFKNFLIIDYSKRMIDYSLLPSQVY